MKYNECMQCFDPECGAVSGLLCSWNMCEHFVQQHCTPSVLTTSGFYWLARFSCIDFVHGQIMKGECGVHETKHEMY